MATPISSWFLLNCPVKSFFVVARRRQTLFMHSTRRGSHLHDGKLARKPEVKALWTNAGQFRIANADPRLHGWTLVWKLFLSDRGEGRSVAAGRQGATSPGYSDGGPGSERKRGERSDLEGQSDAAGSAGCLTAKAVDDAGKAEAPCRVQPPGAFRLMEPPHVE
jgi:hypothetical protein